MARHRDIAGSPVRTAAEVWQVITDLVGVTLGRSATIEEPEVRRTLNDARAAGHALVAGGHLDRGQITVVADPLHLTISTISGTQALKALENENPNPVPGAATATAWTMYLPRPDGLAVLVDEVASDSEYLSSSGPPAESKAASTASVIDLRRLDPSRRS